MKALIISANEYEDMELFVPYYRFLELGHCADIVSMKRGTIKGMHGYDVEVTKTLDEVTPDDYDILVLPGGKAPLTVRRQTKALDIARDFFLKNKPIAAICHGQQILVAAGVLKGRRATSYPNMVEELKAAGAVYEDKEVVVDGNLVTSRRPSDLPAFMREIMKLACAVPLTLKAA